MTQYGSLNTKNGRSVLEFERIFQLNPEAVFQAVVTPDYFSQWYPFATGEMNVTLGGRIQFDDGEGSRYEGEIIELDAPHSFSFQEVDDLVQIKIRKKDQGCSLTFIHTFDDQSMAMYIAAGWHRCLDVLSQLINGHPIEWKDNADELRQYYSEAFNDM